MYWGKFVNTKNKAVELFLDPKSSFEGWVALALLSIIKVTGLVQFGEKSS